VRPVEEQGHRALTLDGQRALERRRRREAHGDGPLSGVVTAQDVLGQ
jgi:hypothetical protein